MEEPLTPPASSFAALRSENDDLRDQLAKLRADKEFVWSLWKKLQATTPDVGQAVSLVAQRERERAEAKDQKVLQILQAKDARLAELESQNARLSSEMSGLMKHLARSEAEASRLRAQVGALQAEAAELRDQAASARLAARQSLDESRAARAAAAADKERRDQLEGQAALLQQVQSLQEGTQAMLETQSDEITGLRTELQRWRDRCSELESRCLAAEGNDDAAARPSAATSPVTDYPYKVAQLEAQVANLKSRLRNVGTTPVPQAMVELQSKVNAANKRAAAAEAELKLRDAEAARLSGELRNKSARVTALKASLRQAKADAEQRLETERLLEENARLQNELALVQVQLDEHAATGQQLRKSLDFERRANAELSQALESANSAAQAAAAQPDEVRELTNELDSARRKVLQLRDLIGRQTRELEGHARARREAEERAESVRAELVRKSQVLIEMKRYLRHLGRRVSGLRTGAATAARRANHNRPTATANSRSQINAESASIIDDEYDEDGEDCGWEDVPTDDCGDGRTAAHKDFDDASVDGLEDVDERQLRQPDSGRSLGRAIANRAKSQGDAHRPMFVARLQARTGALQQQLLQCRRARQKASAERDRLAGEQQSAKDPGYHSEGPTAEDYLTKSDESTSAAAAATAELSDSLARCRQAKSRAERELRVAKDTIDELRRRVREAEAAAASERTAAEKAKTKAGTLKETVRRIQSQLDSARSAATSAGEQRRRFEQLWQESRAELDQARSRARSSAVDSERRRRQIDEASNRAQASEAAAREELLRCENRLSLAERLLGQIARLVEAKSESTRLLVSTHCDRVEALPPPLPPQQQQPVGPTESEVHQLRARQRAASILNLSDGELDSLLMASGSPQQQQQQPTKTKLAELRTAMGSRETDKQWANQCMRLAQAVKAYNSSPNTSSPAELDQLLDKFTEKLDDFVNTVRLLAN
uniref:GRIP domain-containing protein n=1 Tax=Macrostomum lignano TaxID=282301 RepID=A0A1I8H8F9_9PLAT